ncbi:MAG: hypothetical protein ACI3ZD_04250 [Prevotella sp.]
MKTKIEWNGKAIQVSSSHIGIDTPSWGGGYKKHHFKIMVECDGKKFTEDFWQPNEKMSVRGLCEVLENLCMDATYGDKSIDDFNSGLCYEKVSECIRAYNGCKAILEHFKEMFINPYDLGDYLREKYDI